MLQKTATKLNVGAKPLRLAVIGVGNELNGDDAAGVMALRALQEMRLVSSRLLLLDTGPSPENFTSPLVKFSPDWMIVMDAARLGYQPGQIGLFNMEDVDGAGAFTHGLPLSMFGEYLVRTTHCCFSLLAIQVAQTTFGQPPTPLVSRAAVRLAQGVGQVIQQLSL